MVYMPSNAHTVAPDTFPARQKKDAMVAAATGRLAAMAARHGAAAAALRARCSRPCPTARRGPPFAWMSCRVARFDRLGGHLHSGLASSSHPTCWASERKQVAKHRLDVPESPPERPIWPSEGLPQALWAKTLLVFYFWEGVSSSQAAFPLLPPAKRAEALVSAWEARVGARE